MRNRIVKNFSVVLALLFFFAAFSGKSFAEPLGIVLLGPPGSGKGTLAKQLQTRYGLPVIGGGDIVRAEIREGTKWGLSVKRRSDKGLLLRDRKEQMGVLIDKVIARISQPDCAKGFILDGIPRTLWQSKKLSKALEAVGRKVNYVALINANAQTVENRILGRLSCPDCNRNYNDRVGPLPAIAGKCDTPCCKVLNRRSDDTAEVVATRLVQYDQAIAGVINFFAKQGTLASFDGEKAPEDVFQDVAMDLDYRFNMPEAPRDYLQKTIPSSDKDDGTRIYHLIDIQKDPALFRYIIRRFVEEAKRLKPDYIAVSEARGFLFGGALQQALDQERIPTRVLPLRKKGKLPGEPSDKYSVDYTSSLTKANELEMMKDPKIVDKTVLLLDDGIASFGTTKGMIDLVQLAQMKVVGILAVVEHQKARIPEYEIWNKAVPITTLFDLSQP